MRKWRLIGRYLSGGSILFALLISVQLAAPAPAHAAEVSTGASGAPGSTIQVSGRGYLPLADVTICWDEPGCSDMGTADMGLLQTSFNQSVTIPDDATPGQYDIYACQVGCASAPIEVLAAEPPATTTTTTTTTTTPATTTPTTTTTTTTITRPETTSSTTTTTTPSSSTPSTGDGTTTTTVATTESSSPGAPSTTTIPSQADADTSEPTEPLDNDDDSEPTAIASYTPPTSAPGPTDTIEEGAGADVGDVTETAGFSIEAAMVGTPGRHSTPPILFWGAWLVVVALAAIVFYATASRIVGDEEPGGV